MKARSQRLSTFNKRTAKKREKRNAKIAFLKSLSPEEYAEHMEKQTKKRAAGTNVHHRHTRWTGGNNSEENRSVVSVREHHAYNLMFNDGHMHPTEIARKLTEVWIDPEWELVAHKKGSTPQIEVINLKHDCSTCENHKLRQALKPILINMAQEALARI